MAVRRADSLEGLEGLAVVPVAAPGRHYPDTEGAAALLVALADGDGRPMPAEGTAASMPVIGPFTAVGQEAIVDTAGFGGFALQTSGTFAGLSYSVASANYPAGPWRTVAVTDLAAAPVVLESFTAGGPSMIIGDTGGRYLRINVQALTSGQVDVSLFLSVARRAYRSATSLPSPTSAGSVALSPSSSTVAESSRILKNSGANVYGVSCTATVAGFIMLFNSATVPADGAVQPAKVWPIAAGANFSAAWDMPLRLSAGAVLVFSTTGPFTKTASATAFLSGEAL